MRGFEHTITGRRIFHAAAFELPDDRLTGEFPQDSHNIFDIALRGGLLENGLTSGELPLQVGFGHGRESFGERDAFGVQFVRPLAYEKTACVQSIAQIVGPEDHALAAGEMRPRDVGWIEVMHGQLLAIVLKEQRLQHRLVDKHRPGERIRAAHRGRSPQ